MHLSVAIGMNQDAVVCAVCASHHFVDDVVVVPACHVCDRLGTDRTDAALLFPEVGEGPFPMQGLFHLYAKAFFKIEFPGGIVWVAVSFDFLVSGYWSCGGVAKPVLDGLSVFVLCRPEEVPISVARPPEVAVGYPPLAFFRVSPSCPSPQGFEGGRVNMDKGVFSCCVSVKVRPSPYFGIELGYQPVCRSLFDNHLEGSSIKRYSEVA